MHCRKIRRINIFGSGFGHIEHQRKAISKLVPSYGDQLESALLEDMPEGELKENVNACRNAQFDTMIANDLKLLPTLTVFASQLESIILRFRPFNLADLSKA